MSNTLKITIDIKGTRTNPIEIDEEIYQQFLDICRSNKISKIGVHQITIFNNEIIKIEEVDKPNWKTSKLK